MRNGCAPRSPSKSLAPPQGAGFIITIDGPAGVGKSTVAKLLAKQLGLLYIDTGATYRSLAYQAIRKGCDPRDEPAMARLARLLRVSLRQSSANGPQVILHGRNVTRRIRTERVTDAAAIVAQYPAVREELVRLQRRLARRHACVVEGRDTGSVVFPGAAYKFFLTATVRVRAHRRQQELRQIQGHAPQARLIARQLRQRDGLDLRRRIGPLVTPAGAVVLDTSRLSARQVVQRLLRSVEETSCGRARAAGS